MAWTLLILAGLMEVVGVIGLKRTAMKNNWPNHLILIGGFLASFQLLLRAIRRSPSRRLTPSGPALERWALRWSGGSCTRRS